MLSKEDIARIFLEFEKTYFNITIELLRQVYGERPTLLKKARELLDYNLGGGKKFRAQVMIETAFSLVRHKKGAKEAPKVLSDAVSIGLFIEMHFTAILMQDDVLDQSEYRRGKLCWYRKENVGMQAIKDAAFMHQMTLDLLRHCLAKEPYFANIAKMFTKNKVTTLIGQMLDSQVEKKGKKSFERFTLECYELLASFKTAHTTTTFPFLVGMFFAGVTDSEIVDKVEAICRDLGLLFQIQDDVLDVYGDRENTGKDATDIKNGKLTWLIAKALVVADDRQKKVLGANYGTDNVAVVKKIFDEIGIYQMYEQNQKEMSERIGDGIRKLKAHSAPVADCLQRLADRLCKGRKA